MTEPEDKAAEDTAREDLPEGAHQADTTKDGDNDGDEHEAEH